MLIFASMGHEYTKAYTDLVLKQNEYGGFPIAVLPLVLLGCVAGTGIGYSSWWCRDKVSATSFTIIGVLNKCFTILTNYFIWSNHANAQGIACLFFCLVGGAVYKQAPMRKTDMEKSDHDDRGKAANDDTEASTCSEDSENIEVAKPVRRKQVEEV